MKNKFEFSTHKIDLTKRMQIIFKKEIVTHTHFIKKSTKTNISVLLMVTWFIVMSL